MWRIPGWRLLAALAAVSISVGCGGAEQRSKPATAAASRPVTNVALRIAVVKDADLVAAIAKLRGEWLEHGGGELAVEEISLEQALRDFTTDLLIFPSRYLGELCEAHRLRPMRPSVLESKELDFGDILPLVREREIVYGQQVMTLPLGCPTPLVAATSAESGAFVSPLANHYGAFALLARAAPLSRHPSREATWFDPETMEPRLAEPPFVRALTDLVATNSKELSPCELTEQRSQETIPVALVWPCRTSATGGAGTLTVHQIPPATQVYSPSAGQWESTPPRHVTLLATSGRLVGVATQSRNAASAFRLAGWLAGPEVVGQLSTASNGIAICRASQRRTPDNWLGGDQSSSSVQFSEQIVAALSQREGVAVPRLPGVDRYLDALGVAVRTAARGETTPAEALAQAAQEWERTTELLGRDQQRLAYRRGLGIEP